MAHKPHIVQSVGAAIRTVLPKGANPEVVIRSSLPHADKYDPSYRWLLVPEIATDLFAVCGHLCRIGGVVGFFEPSPYARHGDDCLFVFDRAFRDRIDDIVWHWRGGQRGGRPDHPYHNSTREPSLTPPPAVQELWQELLGAWDAPVNCGHYVHQEEGNPPGWWKAALALVTISDLVSVRLFRDPLKRFDGQAMGELLKSLYQFEDRALPDAGAEPVAVADLAAIQGIDGATANTPTATRAAPRGPASLTFLADSSVVCVMPKIRVAAVGATIRNVTRNLALLPGRGELRCFWDMTDAEPDSEDRETLDILLIPAPFVLNATDFQPHTVPNGATTPNDLRWDKPNWESFHLAQNWIGGHDKQEGFIRGCVDLLTAARAETRAVNAVILPEYALTYALFDRLCSRMKDAAPDLEFVVAGASDNCEGQAANTLLTRVWQKRNPLMHITNSRRKHHRWRLDRRQVESYGLGTVLNPMVSHWWETTPIGQRELYFHRFRKDSAFAALICEELARSDVCHDVLRAVGPNLVFALLMDSAQIPGRWSAQYAASLADDPGCAVLSFTSYGLVERANRLRKDGSHSVALWKDDTGNLVQIAMASGEGPRGVLLSLWSQHVVDQTITGKRSNVRAWRYSSHFPVILSRKA
ncbi:hypothetical protein GEU84_009745 [Fertoebacter nigrum]|uniref:Uncharacterized protein n=1 Tax=Fertoeibacter niger TaxID=2656921 RepID=A0A8X8H0E6_9RHOB|nr:hypothetical protein [Fertoeibacter niger]NUB44665.1 hypothetical protein [Fertoeibacter niger]